MPSPEALELERQLFCAGQTREDALRRLDKLLAAERDCEYFMQKADTALGEARVLRDELAAERRAHAEMRKLGREFCALVRKGDWIIDADLVGRMQACFECEATPESPASDA